MSQCLCICLGRGTLDDLRAGVQLSQPSDLAEFLSGFRHTAPALTGDPAAMERVALEFCEDAAANGLVYVEARFCPHLIVNSSPKQGEATADDILEAVLRGFAQGRADFGVHVEALLCCIRGLPQFDRDILRLCEKYRGRGVVGIDIAGDEGGLEVEDPLMFDKQVSVHIKLLSYCICQKCYFDHGIVNSYLNLNVSLAKI